MVNAQEWLEESYPKEGTCLRKNETSDINNYGKTRQEITELDIREQNLTGFLDLTDFTNLKKLNCNRNQLTSIKFDPECCKNIWSLGFRWNKVENIDLSNFFDLEELYASDNELKTLDLSSCKKIKDLYCNRNSLIELTLPPICSNLTNLGCFDNLLTNISFLNKITNPRKMINLNIKNNNFSHNGTEIDIKMFTKFSNLTILSIGNDNKEKLERNIKNKFFGSLRAFRGMTDLNTIYLSNVDVNTDLENLPYSLKRIECSGSLAKKLKGCSITDSDLKEKNDRNIFYCDYRRWRERNESLIISDMPILGKKLGEGGFAKVYQGIWKGNPVAVKQSKISADQMSNEELETFEQEVNFLKKLHNPYIILYIDMFKNEQDLMIITELAQQGSLTDYINQYKEQEYNLDNWKLNYNFIRQITLGLTYLHQSDIIHRDLKSMNVLICEGNIAKISDFGLSKVIDDLTISKTISKGGGVAGTLRWMDPALFKGNSACPQTDIYALGMTIWEIVAKKIPYSHIDGNFVICQILAGYQEEIPNDAPSVLKEIIEGCWEDNLDERISLAEITNKIEEKLKEKEQLESDDEFYDADESFSETNNQEEMVAQQAQIQLPPK